jgi:hypothetical protein
MIPVTNAMTPLIVDGRASFARSAVKTSIPPDFSTSVTSIVMPQTMTIADHGMRLMAVPSSAARRMMTAAAAANALSPIGSAKKTTPTTHAITMASVVHCAAVKCPCSTGLSAAS